MDKKTVKETNEEELDVVEEPKEEEAYIRYEITTYPSDFTLSVLYNKWQNEEIIIPGFQRKFVWDQDRASLLIESFLLGLPVPNVFFYVDQNNKSLVIDGQQRLMTVFYFFDGYFGEADEKGRRKIFKLTGLKEDNPFAGKDYNDIKDTDNGIKFRDSVLRAMNILQLSPRHDDTAIYHIFERLNKGGVSLTPQEVRNCVYRGDFNNCLFDLNSDPNWRKILGKSKADIHYKDIELILRVTALSKNHQKYESPMKEFLNKYMAANQNASKEWLATLSKRFKETSHLIIEKLGEKPFRPFGPINTSMLDSIFAVLMDNFEKAPSDLSERYKNLLSQNLFVRFGTNSTRAVKDRLREVKSILIG
jgi:uncharacterized protein with ParB-like and HNH nuclease domain